MVLNILPRKAFLCHGVACKHYICRFRRLEEVRNLTPAGKRLSGAPRVSKAVRWSHWPIAAPRCLTSDVCSCGFSCTLDFFSMTEQSNIAWQRLTLTTFKKTQVWKRKRDMLHDSGKLGLIHSADSFTLFFYKGLRVSSILILTLN